MVCVDVSGSMRPWKLAFEHRLWQWKGECSQFLHKFHLDLPTRALKDFISNDELNFSFDLSRLQMKRNPLGFERNGSTTTSWTHT